MNDKQDAIRRLGETIEIEGEVRVGNSDVPALVARVTPADLARWRAAADVTAIVTEAMQTTGRARPKSTESGEVRP